MDINPKKSDYFLTLIIICISGNPIFIYSYEYIYVIYTVLLTCFVCLKGKKLLTKHSLYWYLIFIILFIVQSRVLPIVSIPADINYISKFTIGFLTMRLCGQRFSFAYFKIMYYICTISLFFFTIELMINRPLPLIPFDRYYTIGIWNCGMEAESLRNMAMFWEPGAFQGFIMLIPLMFINVLKNLWNTKRKECYIFLITLLSTMSTTAYIVLVLFILMYLLTLKIRPIYKYLTIGAICIGAVIAYTNLTFLGEKIQEELEYTDKTGADKANWSRTGAMIIDFDNISRHPIAGNGFLLETRYQGLGDLMAGAGNGFTGAINMLGIIVVALYFIGLFNNLSPIPKTKRIVVIFTLILLLNGEFYLNYPLFWGLLFVKLPNGIKPCNSTHNKNIKIVNNFCLS